MRALGRGRQVPADPVEGRFAESLARRYEDIEAGERSLTRAERGAHESLEAVPSDCIAKAARCRDAKARDIESVRTDSYDAFDPRMHAPLALERGELARAAESGGFGEIGTLHAGMVRVAASSLLDLQSPESGADPCRMPGRLSNP